MAKDFLQHNDSSRHILLCLIRETPIKLMDYTRKNLNRMNSTEVFYGATGI